jgi:hypothetical protein
LIGPLTKGLVREKGWSIILTEWLDIEGFENLKKNETAPIIILSYEGNPTYGLEIPKKYVQRVITTYIEVWVDHAKNLLSLIHSFLEHDIM